MGWLRRTMVTDESPNHKDTKYTKNPLRRFS